MSQTATFLKIPIYGARLACIFLLGFYRFTVASYLLSGWVFYLLLLIFLNLLFIFCLSFNFVFFKETASKCMWSYLAMISMWSSCAYLKIMTSWEKALHYLYQSLGGLCHGQFWQTWHSSRADSLTHCWSVHFTFDQHSYLK